MVTSDMDRSQKKGAVPWHRVSAMFPRPKGELPNLVNVDKKLMGKSQFSMGKSTN